MTLKAMTPAMTDGKPSMRKRSRQGAMGLSSAHLTMTHAREEAKLVARGAALQLSC